MNYKNVWGAAGIALAGTVGFSVAAQAADLGKRESYHHEEPAYVAPATWAGAYIGGHLGASWVSGSADMNTNILGYTSSAHQDLSETAFLGGIHGGYNFQSGAFVYGIEGDGSWSNSVDYLASVRGRFGVAAARNLLLYGTAGVGFIGTSVSGDIATVTTDGDASLTHRVHYNLSDDQVGFVVGGGAEFKVSPNVSLGVEGLYYGFDGLSANRSFPVGYYGSSNVNVDAGADVAVVRARMSYHFNRGQEPLK